MAKKTEYYTAGAASIIAHITRRQLDYWTEIGLIEPAITAPRGKAGNVKLFDFDNLFKLHVLSALLDSGFSVQALRRLTEDDYDEREQARPEEKPIIASSRSEPVRLDMDGILEAFKRGELDVLPVLTEQGLIRINLRGLYEKLKEQEAKRDRTIKKKTEGVAVTKIE